VRLPTDRTDRVGERPGQHGQLLILKNKYDPANLFRLNANIKPQSLASPG